MESAGGNGGACHRIRWQFVRYGRMSHSGLVGRPRRPPSGLPGDRSAGCCCLSGPGNCAPRSRCFHRRHNDAANFSWMSDAALSALTLSVIGRSAAATKFTVLAALGNIPEVYMTSVSGWVHDTWSTATMLLVESGIALVCLGGAALSLKRYNRADTSLARPSAGGDAV